MRKVRKVHSSGKAASKLQKRLREKRRLAFFKHSKDVKHCVHCGEGTVKPDRTTCKVCPSIDFVLGPFYRHKGEDAKHCANEECGAGTVKRERKECKYCGGRNFLAGPNPEPPAFLKNKGKSKDVKVSFAGTSLRIPLC